MDKEIEELMFGGEDQDLRAIKESVIKLRDRFDSVQVFATRHSGDDGGTINCRWGSGDFFARYGHVRLWVMREEDAELKQGRDAL
jgi:hypothetical protein